jgi:hypothetical protein
MSQRTNYEHEKGGTHHITIKQAVRNIRHILNNYIKDQCFLLKTVNDNLLNIWRVCLKGQIML